MKELIALLKANPGKYSYASPGHGTSPHIACERLFKVTHGLDVVHVPFQGGGPAVQSTIAGHTAILHITLPLIAQHLRTANCARLRSRAAGVLRCSLTCRHWRKPALPNHEVGFWVGVLVPAGTPQGQIDAAPSADHEDPCRFPT